MRRIALVSGASGMVGMQLLHQLFKSSEYDWVISLGRRTLALKQQKLVQIVFDFEKLDQLDLIEKIRENDMGGDHVQLCQHIKSKSVEIHAFSTLGTTIKKAGSKDKFYKIDHDYVLGFARWSIELGANKFLYVSSLGADSQSAIFYNKVKGQIEEDLGKLSFDYLGVFQPSILLGNRNESRLGEEIGKVLMRGVTALGVFKKYKPIYDHQVAKVMVKKALEQEATGYETISSKEMHIMTS